MIAYRAIESDLADTIGGDRTDSCQPDLETSRSSDTAPVAKRTTPDSDVPLVAIIDPRTLGRDSLARALEATESRIRSHTFASLGEWLQNDLVREHTVAILLSIGATEAGDPRLAQDLEFLTSEFSHIPTVVMGDIEEPSHVLGILNHGARGYIPTSVSLSIAVEAISLARAGGLFVPATSLMSTRQAPSERPREAAPLEHLLTARQAAVAEAVTMGKANKIIAYELNLCESTVKVHIRSIMKKLQARNRTEVAYKLHSLAPSRFGSAPGWRSAGSPASRTGPR